MGKISKRLVTGILCVALIIGFLPTINASVNAADAKTKITISDIDNITEKVLKAKSNYSYKEKNDILRHLALLYFFEVYENKDTVTTNELANSYITNNIKRIITIISVLLDEGIIKDITYLLHVFISILSSLLATVVIIFF